MTLFADNFLAGAVLTLVLPTLVLIAIAAFLHWEVTHVPADTPVSAPSLPDRATVAAAEAEAEASGTSLPAPTDSGSTLPGATATGARLPGATPGGPPPHGSPPRDAEPPVTAP